jgi:hypothetical protein
MLGTCITVCLLASDIRSAFGRNRVSTCVHFFWNSSYDSGSPIIIPGKTPDKDLLVAIVSGGEECAGKLLFFKKKCEYIEESFRSHILFPWFSDFTDPDFPA